MNLAQERHRIDSDTVKAQQIHTLLTVLILNRLRYSQSTKIHTLLTVLLLLLTAAVALDTADEVAEAGTGIFDGLTEPNVQLNIANVWTSRIEL